MTDVQNLNILLVDESPERAEVLKQVLETTGYTVAGVLTTGDDISARVKDLQPDVIIVDTDSPDRDTIEQMRTINTTTPRPIVMFTNDDDTTTIRTAVKAGVSAYVVDGLSSGRVAPILEAAIARFNEFHAIRNELEKTRTTLQERKLIDRAKGILMQQRGCSEEEAYSSMRKMAMDRNLKLVELARSLIAAAELLS